MDKCYFNQFDHCKILNVTECEGEKCSFRKTLREYVNEYEKAENRLADKGIVTTIVNGIVKVKKEGIHDESESN